MASLLCHAQHCDAAMLSAPEHRSYWQIVTRMLEGCAHLIVDLSLLRVPQRVIGLIDLLEFLSISTYTNDR